jgi:hypothetical protein
MDEKFTDAFMAEQRELAERATARPWVNMTDETFWGQIRTASDEHFTEIARMPELDDRTDDFEYIAEAANHYPDALDAIDRLRAENDSLRADFANTGKLFKNLLDVLGLLVWKAGGAIIITDEDKFIMPDGVNVEVVEDKAQNKTTFRIVGNFQDTAQP